MLRIISNSGGGGVVLYIRLDTVSLALGSGSDLGPNASSELTHAHTYCALCTCSQCQARKPASPICPSAALSRTNTQPSP